jgi:recombination protein RecT
MGERGQVVGFYAVAKLQGGGHAFEFMSVHQVREIARATQSKGNYGPWKDHFTEMGRKTVIRRLAKYLPLSIEFQTAVALDGMAEAGKDQGNTIDGSFNFVPDDAPAQAGVDGETGEIVRAGAIAGQEPPAFDIDAFAARIAACVDLETLQVLSDEAEELPDGPDRDRAMQALIQRDRQLASAPAPTPAPTPTQSPAASPAARVARRGAGSAGQTVIE